MTQRKGDFLFRRISHDPKIPHPPDAGTMTFLHEPQGSRHHPPASLKKRICFFWGVLLLVLFATSLFCWRFSEYFEDALWQSALTPSGHGELSTGHYVPGDQPDDVGDIFDIDDSSAVCAPRTQFFNSLILFCVLELICGLYTFSASGNMFLRRPLSFGGMYRCHNVHACCLRTRPCMYTQTYMRTQRLGNAPVADMCTYTNALFDKFEIFTSTNIHPRHM